ncbi:MAG: hypothetical protein OQL16_10290, partial [Gammaproteobacteria bacterium]|nr:hypothetical protein [Gammaproteobacteria bacterium]
EQLITTVHEIEEAKKSIDWPIILQSQPTIDNPAIELIPRESKYDIKPTRLSRLASADWKRLVSWLQNDGFNTGERLIFKQLKQLPEQDKTVRTLDAG